jgi:exodeoxyribonuclease V alpha subunit
VSFSDWFNENSIDKSKPEWLEAMKAGDEVSKEAVVLERVVFMEDSGYSVYICEDEDDFSFKVTGTFPLELLEGQTYFFRGKVVVYRGNKQIQCKSARLEKPTTKHGVVSFLRTLKGIDKKAVDLYNLYGSEIVDILLKDPMRVASEVRGIGKKSVISWRDQLKLLEDDYRTLSVLIGYGITMKQAKKLFEKFNGFIIQMIEENPYCLADHVKGFGFLKCDEIARQVGFDPKSNHRIHHGMLHVLKESSNDGHCFLPRHELIYKAKGCLNYRLTAQEMKQLIEMHKGKISFQYAFGSETYTISYKTLFNHWCNYEREQTAKGKDRARYCIISLSDLEIEEELLSMEANMKVVVEGNSIYLVYLYYAEKKVAERILRLLLDDASELPDVEQDIADYLKRENIHLEDMQNKAVSDFAKTTGGMYILNGSAGCGKTFTLKVILAILERQYKKLGKECRIKIFAPTGKASKVAKRATGRPCTTVHRGLGFIPGVGYLYNADNPLEVEIVVLDESSMLDILLAQDLFDAIPPGCKVIFMGDTKQLPSVGAGNVLHDLIQSGVIPVITLDVVKRQAEHSGIIRNANKIIRGEMISSCTDTEDAYVIRKQLAKDVQEGIVQSIERLIEGKNYAFDDIQVLCPQKNGEVGTFVMNWVLQQTFNPNPEGEKILNKMIRKKHPDREEFIDIPLHFQAGDKVIHVANNYQMPWYQKNEEGALVESDDPELIGITNGECGVIEEIRKVIELKTKSTIVTVRYEDGYVQYVDSVDELDHAYALTIHKSQGSQWRAVIIPLMMENFRMLDNNLFYTGYTRSKDFSVTIGQPEAINHAVTSYRMRERYTSLAKQFLPEAS